MRDFTQSPDTRTHRRCDVCAVDAVLTPERVAAWEQEHRHEEGEK